MGRLAACAVVLASRAGGLYLDVPVDGRVLTIEYEASNTYTELWRYAEAFEAEHGLRRFYDQWAKCAPVIYARYKCVTSEILKAMQAHRDAAHALAKDFAYRAMGRWDAFYAAGDDACFAAYCAAHADLADALCGGAACDAPGPLRACREHWEGYGRAEGREPDPRCSRLKRPDGLELDAVPADAYDAVVSFDALSRIPFHATRYRLLEEFFRVLKCDGRASLAMGFGAFHGSVAGYRDDVPVDDGADVQVAFDDPDLLVHDLDRVGFRDMAYWISTGGSGTHAKTLTLEELPQAQGTNRKYVDAEIPRKRPTVSGVREELRNMKTTELVKRARRDGVSPETIDDALDADAPRDALAEVLLAHWDLDDEGGEPDEWPCRARCGGARGATSPSTRRCSRCASSAWPRAADARAVASGCFALLGAFMAYAVYIALCAMKAYTVSVGNLPEPEHDSDDSAYGHSHFHGHESSDSDKED
ncbi:hypothetical protein JL721_8517 [Aureococcus anophagefferens]|nr:hypothetical protein JL721_8517 [Aureococcus anophagefferens]